MIAGEWRRKAPSAISIDVVVPVLNEAHVLSQSVRQIHAFLDRHVPYQWRIVVAENGSTDETVPVALSLCRELPRVHLITLAQRGRGRALRVAWTESRADILCYTDVDLSTALEAFPRLFSALIDEGYDIAIGSRLAAGSRTTRSLRRELISRIYNRLLKLALKVRFSDAQAGFKAVTREVVDRVIPLVEDNSWFLDTELLVLAEKLGYRIADIPVTWVEDDDSRVKIVRTALGDLRGIWRLRRRLRELRGSALMTARPQGTNESALHQSVPDRSGPA